ncbi:protease prsW family protein [Nitzschia inconspicua]|uniref:Protease prsW family protein n=1 Tax=Nitzschia inconspicua TaxID=303405 RepID=A0A9K3LI10_9STRA|nr:protease prsW family protein [Nitzschia inconspicua]
MGENSHSFLFHSGLCDMFHPSKGHHRRHSKTDACALAFCGIWLWERNRFLLTGERPKKLRERPVELSIVFLLVATAVVWSLDPYNIFLPVSLLLAFCCLLWKIFEFQYTRSVFRQRLAMEAYQQEQKKLERDLVGEGNGSDAAVSIPNGLADDPRNDAELMLFLGKHKREIYGNGSHSLCDILPTDSNLWQRDYVTLQSWHEYYPAILRLRLSGKMNFLSHLKAMSSLSNGLAMVATILLLSVTLVTILPVRFPKWQILVLYGTLLQPALVLFVIYWWWHRLDISLDAIIKYFASGFFICTGLSILYELMASIILSMAIYFVSIIGAIGLIMAGSIGLDDLIGGDDVIGDASSGDFPLSYSISIAFVTALFNAYLVAASVEELVKYLSFWMVEHPDLELERITLTTSIICEVNENEGESEKLKLKNETTPGKIPETFSAPSPSFITRGAAYTVAMITTALGFACAENLLYVFVYTPPGINEEISTLLVRCLFPIHPLAAAIQSLGVCRRDLEKQTSFQLGRILFPAWLLHGSFDFLLMAYSLITQILSGTDGKTRGSNNRYESSLLVPCVMIIPFIGIIFYFQEAWAQRKRLETLDSGNVNGAD